MKPDLKNHRTTLVISCIDRLLNIADSNKSVYVKNWGRLQPAKWLIHMQAAQLSNWIKRGWIIEVVKKK